MTDTPHSFLDDKLVLAIDEVSTFDLDDPDTKIAMENLLILCKSRSALNEGGPAHNVPETFLARAAFRVARIWDNETTRVFLKAGGALAGVGVVAYSTIHKDHVMERQALAQANQKPVQ